jgi:hypothetical protein
MPGPDASDGPKITAGRLAPYAAKISKYPHGSSACRLRPNRLTDRRPASKSQHQ